jgi:putative membrane protein
MMINHHTRSAAELARLQGTRGASRAEPESEPKSQMLDKLRSSARAEFDMNYVQGRLAAHVKAVELHRTYAATGQNAALRQFAQRATDLVQDHLSRARALPRSPR